MKPTLIRLFFVFFFSLLSANGFTQKECYLKYKFVNESIEGFSKISFESIPEKIGGAMKKDLKRNLFDKEDTILYSRSETENYCLRFLQKFYEATFIIYDKEGKKLHTIIFINPEYSEFGEIYDQISESNYVLPAIESPYSPVRKNITPGKTWFEVYLGKQVNDDFEIVLIFNEHFKQIAFEKI